jgi:NAD(P)-dependent dehydrogenase (short-subunit alcohol dehydrogenase family)
VKASLSNLCILLTGATSGIGRMTAEALCGTGVRLLVSGRDPRKLEELVSELSAAGAPAQGFLADFSSLEQTARLARGVRRAVSAGALDALINNAGIGFGRDSSRREISRDGFELRFAVNYLAPFLLSEQLLGAGMPRRVLINVASAGQEPLDLADLMTVHGYSGVRAYRRSKLALVMATLDWAQRHPGLQVHALHPGTFLDTQMVREAGIPPQGPVQIGVDSILAVLRTALLGGESGRYFEQGQPSRAHPQAYDRRARRSLREASLQIVAPFL